MASRKIRFRPSECAKRGIHSTAPRVSRQDRYDESGWPELSRYLAGKPTKKGTRKAPSRRVENRRVVGGILEATPGYGAANTDMEDSNHLIQHGVSK